MRQTKTAPAADARPQVVSFAFVSYQTFPQGFYTVCGQLAREQIDFCVQLGDNIYEVGHVPTVSTTVMPASFRALLWVSNS